MSKILTQNYNAAKDIRYRQVVGNIDKYKAKYHNSDNRTGGVILPQVGHPVLINFPGKHNSLKFGVIIGINSSAAL